MTAEVRIIPISPFTNQKPGTSGLRKHVDEFMQPHYTESFTQSILLSLGNSLQGCCLVVGGDGRYYTHEAIQKIIQICAANGVGKLLVGQNGILSTPAVSCLIRKHSCDGGIILTASHNPGGVNGSFGIKFNNRSGAPASQRVGDDIYSISRGLKKYSTCPALHVDTSVISIREYLIGQSHFSVQIIDSTSDYVDLLKNIFDFGLLRRYLGGGNRILINCLNGVMGPYAFKVFCDELGCPPETVVNGVPLPDFGGRHPDPNLTYATDLVESMSEGMHQLGAAFDGDGDRCMIIGQGGLFLTPCDMLALVAEKISIIPAFADVAGALGVARSMPTSSAVDKVADKLGMACFETPTGWKFFGNLLDEGLIALCGEESFGIGSNHIREKDGMWGALAVLSIMAHTGKSLSQLCEEHWRRFGRVYFTRYDYEEVDDVMAAEVMETLQKYIIQPNINTYTYNGRTAALVQADNFKYEDPVDGSVTTGQGVRLIFDDSSRVVFRLSGTGTSGATIRLYAERHGEVGGDAQGVLGELIEFALGVSRLSEITGRDAPSVIT